MVTFQRVSAKAGTNDPERCLIFVAGTLVAILGLDIREHDGIRGNWFLEMSFDRCFERQEPFDSIGDAMAWAEEHCAA